MYIPKNLEEPRKQKIEKT